MCFVPKYHSGQMTLLCRDFYCFYKLLAFYYSHMTFPHINKLEVAAQMSTNLLFTGIQKSYTGLSSALTIIVANRTVRRTIKSTPPVFFESLKKSRVALIFNCLTFCVIIFCYIPGEIITIRTFLEIPKAHFQFNFHILAESSFL